MLLKKVRLENFISHKNSEVEFDYGINVITGPNGAGKTSILDAVSFGLFNVHSRGKNENLVHKSAEKAKVAVEFSEGGIDYVVEWDIDRKKKQVKGVLFRIQNGERSIIARGGSRVVTSEVEKILGLDELLFQQSIYIQQGEIEKLVTTTPAERKQIISKLLGIDYLEKAYLHMREVLSEYEKTASTLSGELKKKPDIESRFQRLTSEIESLKTRLDLKNTKLNEIEITLKRLDAELKELDQKKEIFIELNSRKAVLETKVASLNETLTNKEAELKEAENAYSRLEALKEAVAKLPLMENYLGLYQKLNEKEKEKNLENQKLEYIKGLKEALKQNEESYKTYLEKNALLKQKREERKNYEGANEKLATLEKQLQKDKKKLDKRLQNLSQKLEEYSKILEEKVTRENIELVLANKKDEIGKLKSELEGKADRLQQEIGTIQAYIEDVRFKLSKISEADICPICGRELTPDHKGKLQQEFEEALRVNNEKISKLESELKKATAERKKCEKILEKLASIDPEKIKEIESDIEELNGAMDQELREIEKLKQEAVVLKKIDEEILTLEKEIAALEDAYQNYETAKRELAKWPSMSEVETNINRIDEEINVIRQKIEDLIGKLGYKPENPEQELAGLRQKKGEYDRSEPIAKKRDALLIEVQNLRKELSVAKEELSKILIEIKELGYDEGLHQRVREDFENKAQEKNELEKEIVKFRTEIQSKEAEKSMYESELKQLIEKEQEMKTIEEFIKILEKIRGAFHKDGLQRLIRARSRPLLERYTREFFERFNLEFSDVQIDDDYNISVIGPVGAQTIDQISGGERVALAIALRLAIARVLSERVETIIMDEPTTHLDEERRKELVNILNSFFREGGRIIPQMIVITHHHEIEDIADVTYNVSKKEGCSVVEVEV
ncbi:MAG: AAA family ATPase [Candidatus Bathyarchaeia archaeon]